MRPDSKIFHIVKFFSHLFRTYHPTVKQKMVLGTLQDCLKYCHKVTKTSSTILDLSDGTSDKK